MVSAHITHQDPPCTPAGGMIGNHALQTTAHGIARYWAGVWAGIGSGAGPGWRNLFRLLGDCFAAERERWILWAPVGIGLGVVCYFALPAEPPGWIGAVAASLLALLSVLLRRRDGALLVCLALLTPMLGFAAAQVRTSLVAAPILVREVGPVPVTGRVIGIDKLEKGGRVVLTDLSIPRVDPAATPDRVRLRLRNAAGTAAAGRAGADHGGRIAAAGTGHSRRL